MLAAVLSQSDAYGDVITLYSSPVAYQNAVAALGLSSITLDFESQPDETPAGPGSPQWASPATFNLAGGANSATFTTPGHFVFETFAWQSAAHSLRENGSSAVVVTFARPVFAVGVYALDIDNFVSNAATALYSSTTLPPLLQQFDNRFGRSDARAFLGAIATDDSLLHPRAVITTVTYDQANAKTPEFTYLDDFTVAVPEPSAISAMLSGIAVARRRRRKGSRTAAVQLARFAG